MMQNLPGLFAQYGVETLLSNTKTLIALIQADGALLEWNPAFGQMKESLPAASHLQDFLASSGPGQARFAKLLHSKNSQRQSLELPAAKDRQRYDCMLVALPGGNSLFMAEPAPNPQNEEVAKLTHDLRATKHALRVNKTGLESVLVQVDEIVHVDQLTFLSNQRKIVGDLQRKVTLSYNSRKPLTIFMLDIDYFKQINDTYGHMAGDHVLRTLASRLRDSIRQSDAIGRYGGEEFLILLPGASVEAAIPTAERLLKMVRALKVDVGDQVVRTTVSLGIAQYQRGETWKELLERADKALYLSKKDGRDRWSVSKPEPGNIVP